MPPVPPLQRKQASTVLQHEEEEQKRAAAEAVSAHAAEVQEKNEEISRLKAALAEKDTQLEQKTKALEQAVASGQKEILVTQASKMYSSAARLQKIRGKGGAQLTQLMERAASSQALAATKSTPVGKAATKKPSADFLAMLQKQRDLASGTATVGGEARTGRGKVRRASLDALFQSSSALNASLATKAAAAEAAKQAGELKEEEEEEEEEDGGAEDGGTLSIGDRIDDALAESFVDTAAITAILRDATASKSSHPGINALNSKLDGLLSAEPEPEPAEEGVPVEGK